MALGESLLIYLLVGVAVAAAVALSNDRSPEGIGPTRRGCGSMFRIVAATFFWPLFLPIVLSQSHASDDRPRTYPAATEKPCDEPNDAMARRIAQVDGELVAALASLDGWAEGAIARERLRIDELRTAWNAQAKRIRDMDGVLAAAEPDPHADTAPEAPSDAPNDEPSTRAAQSARARRGNLARLRQVRDRAESDLATTLASVRELVSMIHLAKFTGEPASRADELLAQIAAAVEGLSEVAHWNDAPAA